MYFYSNNSIVDTLIIHSENLVQQGSLVYRVYNSKATKNILQLLEEQLKVSK